MQTEHIQQHIYHYRKTYARAFAGASLLLLMLVSILIFSSAPQQYRKAYYQLYDVHNAPNIDKALPLLLKSADKNYADALFLLGKLYQQGKWVEQDLEQATRWYQKAAHANDNSGRAMGQIEAQYRLGDIYYQGQAIGKDDKKAFEYYLQAAQAGHMRAQQRVGYLYQWGKGVNADMLEAYAWTYISAQLFHPAKLTQELLLKKLSPQQRTQANLLAQQYQQKYYQPDIAMALQAAWGQ